MGRIVSESDGGGITARKTAVVALFAFVLGAAGFFNTFDISSGKINVCHPGDIGTAKCPISTHGLPILLFNNETVNVINPIIAGGTFDNLETYSLPANSYSQILVEANINVTGSTSLGQTTDIAFFLWYGSTRVNSYTLVQSSGNPALTNGFFFTWSQGQVSPALIKVNATTITKFGVGSVENFRVWGIT